MEDALQALLDDELEFEQALRKVQKEAERYQRDSENYKAMGIASWMNYEKMAEQKRRIVEEMIAQRDRTPEEAFHRARLVIRAIRQRKKEIIRSLFPQTTAGYTCAGLSVVLEAIDVRVAAVGMAMMGVKVAKSIPDTWSELRTVSLPQQRCTTMIERFRDQHPALAELYLSKEQ